MLICLANGTEIRRNNTIQILRWAPQHTVSCCFDSFFILCLVDFHFQWFIVVCLKSAYFVYKYRPSYRVCIIILYNLRKNHNTIQTLFKHKRSHKNKKKTIIYLCRTNERARRRQINEFHCGALIIFDFLNFVWNFFLVHTYNNRFIIGSGSTTITDIYYEANSVWNIPLCKCRSSIFSI